MVQGITVDRYGAGYSGIGYRTSGVKPLTLAAKEGAPFVGTSYEEVAGGAYPLARFLYLYINRAPNQPPDPMIREFVRYVLSREGQEIVVKDGYLPLVAKIVAEEANRLR